VNNITELFYNAYSGFIGNLTWHLVVLFSPIVFYPIAIVFKRYLNNLLIQAVVFTGISYVIVAIIYWNYLVDSKKLLLICLIINMLPIWYLWRFHRLGIANTFYSTALGLDYKWSLRRPRRSFDFLGVGAHKLTSLPDFRKMVERCSSGGRPVRLLLSDPDNRLLKKIARRSGSDRDEYSMRVRKSLENIATLKIREGFNIEVNSIPLEAMLIFISFGLFLSMMLSVLQVILFGTITKVEAIRKFYSAHQIKKNLQSTCIMHSKIISKEFGEMRRQKLLI